MSDNMKNRKLVKVLRTKWLIYLFPDFEFSVRNNENDDANDLTDESYQSNY